MNDAKDLKFSRNTITIKDENDKTRGMIRDITRFSDATSREKSNINSLLTKMGISRSDIDDIGGLSKIYSKDNKIYILNDVSLDKLLSEQKQNDVRMTAKQRKEKGLLPFEEVFGNDVLKVKNKNRALKNFEAKGAFIINYNR